jgi:hypothetical protein
LAFGHRCNPGTSSLIGRPKWPPCPECCLAQHSYLTLGHGPELRCPAPSGVGRGKGTPNSNSLVSDPSLLSDSSVTSCSSAPSYTLHPNPSLHFRARFPLCPSFCAKPTLFETPALYSRHVRNMSYRVPDKSSYFVSFYKKTDGESYINEMKLQVQGEFRVIKKKFKDLL